MNRPDLAVGYAAVLRLPGVPRALTAATLGRLSYASLPLSLLVAVEDATGSLTTAGTALAAFAVAAVAMPAKSRLVDRLGRARVLPALSAVLALALLGVAVLVAHGTAPAGVLVALSAAAGLAAPPLGPTVRALWAALAPDPALRQRAYSLDGVIEEVLYPLGPLLVGLVLVADPGGGAALAGTAVLNLLGAVGVAATSSPGPTGTAAAVPHRGGLLGPLRDPGFRLLVLATLGVGLGTGPLDVAVLARAQEAGRPGAAGVLLAALAVGSALGGLARGAVTHRRAVSAQLGAVVAVLAAGLAAAAAATTLPSLGVALTLAGAAVAPALVVAYLAADHLAPGAARTEATTWVSTGFNAGIALGAAGAGALVAAAGPGGAFLAGAGVLGLVALLVMVSGDRLGAGPGRSVPGGSVGPR